MTPKQLTRTLGSLRHSSGMSKTAGVGKTIVDVAKAVQGGANRAGEELLVKGHPLLGFAAKSAPVVAGAEGVRRAYESEPGQKLRYKIRLWKARRAAKRQQGYY